MTARSAAITIRDVARRRPELRLKVEALPARIDGAYVRALDGRHGPLSLALERRPDGKLAGGPFVVPGGRFNELYGWDTHFIALGLLADGRIELARSMVDDQVYEIRRYGHILNANRTYYLTRSQPPLLTSSLLEVEKRLAPTGANRAWLKAGLEAAIAEYRGVWTASPRLVAQEGLSRYYDEGSGPCPEVEPGHYDPILRPYALAAGLTPELYLAAYASGRLKNPALDAFFLQDRAERESGHDTTYRFDDRAADFLTVDLNSLLYKTETDVADMIERRFDGALTLESGEKELASDWRALAEKRKKRMNALFWDPERGLFFDYDLKNRRRSGYVSATGLYPLWAGWATPEQAAAAVKNSLRDLERLGGLAATSKASRREITAARPARQWDYPYGWPPHQILAWQGLARYGFDADARRLAYRWMWTIVKNARDYNGTVPEKYDVVKASHQVFAEYGNIGTKFAYITKEGFGWMNASYGLGLKGSDPGAAGGAARADCLPSAYSPPPAPVPRGRAGGDEKSAKGRTESDGAAQDPRFPSPVSAAPVKTSSKPAIAAGDGGSRTEPASRYERAQRRPERPSFPQRTAPEQPRDDDDGLLRAVRAAKRDEAFGCTPANRERRVGSFHEQVSMIAAKAERLRRYE